MTLSFQPLSLAEVHRRRAARSTSFVSIAPAPEPAVEAAFDVLDLTDADEVR